MPIRFTFDKEHSFIYYNHELKNYSLHNKMKFFPPQIIFIPVLVIILRSGCNNTTGVELERHPVIRFSKTYFQGEIDYVIPASDGGFTSLGWINTPNVNGHLLLLKTDEDGKVEWSKTFSNENDYPNSLLKTVDGGYLILAIRGGSTPKYGELLIIKTDDRGNEEWSKTYEDSIDDSNSARMQPAQDGGFVITFVAQRSNFGIIETILKISETGDIIWRRILSKENWGLPIISQTIDNGFIIVAVHDNSIGPDSISITKLDNDGNTIWKRKHASHFLPWAMIKSHDGNYISSGIIIPGNSGRNASLMKVSSEGEIMWSKSYQHGPYQNIVYDSFNSIDETDDGDIITVGYTNRTVKTTSSDAQIMKTDKNGNEKWSYILPGNRGDALWSVKHVKENIFIAAGATSSGDNPNQTAWLIKFDLSACDQWVKKK